jgi:sterol desaturase/sphingolipid hydroxylase (fatty acid hydroxylase superfamily)
VDLFVDLATRFQLRTILIAALIAIPLERVFSLHAEQRILRRSWANDLFYQVFNRWPIGLMMLALAGIVTAATELVPQPLREAVAGSPLAIQLLCLPIVADLGFYAAHRLFHTVPWLWQFHAVHHSVKDMDWLAASRIHFVDLALTKTLSILPMSMLGFGVEAISIHALIYTWQTYAEHGNIRLTLGPLRWLVAGPEFHHWHHAYEREGHDKNFAGQLPFLDLLFGTAYMPKGRMPAAYGIDDRVPSNYLAQLLYPFMRILHMMLSRTTTPARREATISQP